MRAAVALLRLSCLAAGVCGLNLQSGFLSDSADRIAKSDRIAEYNGLNFQSDFLSDSADRIAKSKRIAGYKRLGYGWKSAHGHNATERAAIYMDGQGYRQSLLNVYDAQYIVYFGLGGQTLSGIVDTGSFEFVVFDQKCGTCGNAGKYDSALSRSYQLGNMLASHYYGSGRVQSEEAWDFLNLGPMQQVNQSFWQVTRADMRVLEVSHFNAIIGVGPPSTPLSDAWSVLQNDVSHGAERMASNGSMDDGLVEKLRRDVELVRAAKHRPTVLQNMNGSLFSICFGKEPESDGMVVWDDNSALRHPELFHKVPVKGNNTWAVEAKNVRLSYMRKGAPVGAQGIVEEEHLAFDNATDVSMGCEDRGCPFLLDSGTSLLTLPAPVVHKLTEIYSRTPSCDTMMADLPYILFDLNGKTMSLPPDVYVARVENVEVPEYYLQDSVRIHRLGHEKCNLLVLETQATTRMGHLWVLGMPFFRKYYTSFQVAPRAEDRAIYLAGATDQCTPTHRRAEVHDGPAEMWQRTIYPAKLWVPLARKGGRGLDYVRL